MRDWPCIRWTIVLLLALAGLTACNDNEIVHHVSERVDTTITRHFDVIARDGEHCHFDADANDTITITPGDTIRCNWSKYGY